MKILQANKYYHPQIGGIEQVVKSLAEGLHNRGHDSQVIASKPYGVGFNHQVESVPVRKTSSLGVLQSVPLAPTYPLRLYQESRSVDLIHHHLPNPLSVISTLLMPQTEATSVATYHSDIVRQEWALKWYRPLLHRFLDNVDHIITTSPHLKNNSTHLSEYTEKTSVIPLSVDLDKYGVVGQSLPMPPEADNGPLLLFVGRLNYYKGVEHLIEAMKSVLEEVPTAELVLIGDGERLSSIQQQTANLGITEKVSIITDAEDKTLHQYYDAADLFILPSVEPSEAFGIVQLEAMSYGTPVINTSLPTGVPWVSKDEETGLTVPPADPTALANSIIKLLQNETLRDQYAEQARNRVNKKFSQERMIDQTEELYKELLKYNDA